MGIVKDRELASRIRRVVTEKLGAHPARIISFPVRINWLVVQNGASYCIALQKLDDDTFSMEASLVGGGPRVRASVLSSSEENVFLAGLTPEQAHRHLDIVPGCSPLPYKAALALLRQWGEA